MAKKEENAVAVVKEDLELTTFDMDLMGGLVVDASELGIDQSDIKIPKYKLTQPTSQEVASQKVPAGVFLNQSTGVHYEELECLLIMQNKTRTMWADKYKKGDSPVCRSFDGITSWDGKITCATCEFKDWDKKQDGDNKPKCNQSYYWLGIDQDGSPFRIAMSGSSVSNTKDFLTFVTVRRMPFCVFKVKLVSERVENDKGTFYVAKYKVVDSLTTIVLKEMGKTIAEVKGDKELRAIHDKKLAEKVDEYKSLGQSLSELFRQGNKIDVETAIDVEPASPSATVETAPEGAESSQGALF